MIDLNKLSDAERVFINEYKVYNHSLSILDQYYHVDEIKRELGVLSSEYFNLLEQAVKLVKISDSTQLKLRNTQALLKEQNAKIEEQNQLLQNSNKIQQNLLNVIDSELSRAADYVKSILPPPFSKNEIGLNINWKFIPSSKLGGDMFGYQMLDEENLSIYLLDVCGHGIRSALYSVSVINAINYKSMPGVDPYSPSSVFTGLNKMFDMRAHNDLYFTIWYGVYNIYTKKMTYSSAGHPPGFIINSDNNRNLLVCDNFFIGGIKDYKFEESSCLLRTGDSLFIYSDGAYEIRKNETEYFTIDELFDYISANLGNDNILDMVYSLINSINYDTALEDDFSIMKIDIL